MAPEESQDRLTQSGHGDRSREERLERDYLLVLDGSSARPFSLPAAGELIVGRTPDAGLCVPDPSVSRAHARLTIGPAEIRIADMGSRNGTLVNGEKLRAERVLLSGDVIAVGDISLVLHRLAAPWTERASLDAAALLRRLEEEIERSLRYQRPLGVACLLATAGMIDRPRILLRLRPHLRLMDVVAFRGAGELLLLLPEVAPGEARRAARRLCEALGTSEQGFRAGVACCPEDGAEAETLLSGAAAAAAAAAPGAVAGVESTAQVRAVGGVQVVVADPAMTRLFALLEKLAASALPILLLGETGTGKEIAARLVHERSPRSAGPFVSLNCAAIPEALFESELFGHERGAFTGAVAARRGHFEAADGGTLFLDEIGDLPVPIQAKLLRLLETRSFTRLGETKERSADVRFLAATHRDLAAEVAAGRFREDLLFRLSAARVALPPLRDRRRELPLLARALLAEACGRLGKPVLELSPLCLRRLLEHRWPGNVRELRNAMDYVATTVTDGAVEPWHLPEYVDPPPPAPEGGGDEAREPAANPQASSPSFRPVDEEVRELERTRMLQALKASGGQRRAAAELIGMPRRTFATKLKLYGLAGEDPE